MSSTTRIIEEITKEVLEKTLVTANVNATAEEDTVIVQIDTEDSGMLIGFRGKTLEALQMMIGQLTFRKLGVWVRVNVSVGDYRQRQTEKLKQMALDAAQEVVETGQSVFLPQLSAYERRIVHMTLQDHSQVVSESEGMGRNRRLLIKLKSEA